MCACAGFLSPHFRSYLGTQNERHGAQDAPGAPERVAAPQERQNAERAATFLVRAPTMNDLKGAVAHGAVMQLVWARCELSRVREPQREALQCCACRNAASTQRAAFRARILSKDLGFRNAQGA